jgi:hypothetical protein
MNPPDHNDKLVDRLQHRIQQLQLLLTAHALAVVAISISHRLLRSTTTGALPLRRSVWLLRGGRGSYGL